MELLFYLLLIFCAVRLVMLGAMWTEPAKGHQNSYIFKMVVQALYFLFFHKFTKFDNAKLLTIWAGVLLFCN